MPADVTAAKQIISGNRYKPNTDVYISGYRAFLHTGTEYEFFSVLDPLGAKIVDQLFSTVGLADGWVEYTLPTTLLRAGTTIDFVMRGTSTVISPVTLNANYNYVTPQNAMTPAAGFAVQSGKSIGTISFSYTDNDAIDRTAALQALVLGDKIQGPGSTWTIQSSTDMGTYIDFIVAPALQGSPDGVFAFVFETTQLEPINYGKDLDWWSNQVMISPPKGLYIENGLYDDIVPDGSAYGMDVLFQQVVASEDWDPVAYGGTSVSGGGSGGVTIHNDLTGRDVADGHPIEAITGLQAALDGVEATGLEKITEGGDTGWRLIGKDPTFYGDIGPNAVDTCHSASLSSVVGATGESSHAEGFQVIASGIYSHAEGGSTQATGGASHAEGLSSQATATASHAEGASTLASAPQSHAEGQGTIAQNQGSHAGGKFNVGTSVDTIREVGIGTGFSDRKNGFEVYRDGTLTAPESTKALIDSRGDKALITKEYLQVQDTNTLFSHETSDFNAQQGNNYITDGAIEMTLDWTDSEVGSYIDLVYNSGTIIFDWEVGAPPNMPSMITGHMYRIIKTAVGWLMYDLT